MLARNNDVAVARGLRQPRLEVLEHVELCVERLARVQVPAVLARPEERLAVGRRARRRRCRSRAWPAPRDPRRRSPSPTRPTTCTWSKNDAASAKYVAAPPSMRSRTPNGVLTASNATDPTTVMLTRRRPRRGAEPGGRAQRGGLVGPLPREVVVLAAEVTVRRGLLVDRPVQAQVLAERARTQVEVLADQLEDPRAPDLLGPERLDHDRHGVRHADRVGHLDLGAVGQARRRRRSWPRSARRRRRSGRPWTGPCPRTPRRRGGPCRRRCRR